MTPRFGIFLSAQHPRELAASLLGSGRADASIRGVACFTEECDRPASARSAGA